MASAAAIPRRRRWCGRTSRGKSRAAASLTFDGLPLPLDAADRGRSARAARPHGPPRAHGGGDFPSRRPARREIAYGGEYGSEVSTELTARAGPGRAAAICHRRSSSRGWLTAGGKPLPVAAVEQGPAQLYVVAASGTTEALVQLLSRKTLAMERRRRHEARPGGPLRLVPPFSQRFDGSGERSDLFDDLPPSRFQPRGGLLSLLITSRASRLTGSGPRADRRRGGGRRPGGGDREPPARRAAGAPRRRERPEPLRARDGPALSGRAACAALRLVRGQAGARLGGGGLGEGRGDDRDLGPPAGRTWTCGTTSTRSGS